MKKKTEKKPETVEECKARWVKTIAKNLVGKTVSKVRYLTEKEMDAMGWYSTPVAIIFNDGSFIVPQMDDEGNDGGAMFTSFEDVPVIPVIRR